MTVGSESPRGGSNISVGQHVALLLRGDFTRGLAAFAEDVVWHVPGGGELGGDHRGREAMLALIERLLAPGQSELESRVLLEHGGYLVEWLELHPTGGATPVACPIVSRSCKSRIGEVWLCGNQAPSATVP